jgi:phosphoglycolate phosphatase
MASSSTSVTPFEYDAFLFDLDGTLLDTADDLGAALNAVLKSSAVSSKVPSKSNKKASYSKGVTEVEELAITLTSQSEVYN